MSSEISIPAEKIEKFVYTIRNKKVVLDLDLAALYGIPTKNIKEAVKRNMNRFPADHMFSLNKSELEKLKRKISTSHSGGMNYGPMAFTADGVNMLSSVLNNEKNQAI
ncbi:MAG TPA: ORF6N domain-containing protein [Ignavibacteria bacterium]|jgi:hypothetical protein